VDRIVLRRHSSEGIGVTISVGGCRGELEQCGDIEADSAVSVCRGAAADRGRDVDSGLFINATDILFG
jgi:hypothetical protein